MRLPWGVVDSEQAEQKEKTEEEEYQSKIKKTWEGETPVWQSDGPPTGKFVLITFDEENINPNDIISYAMEQGYEPMDVCYTYWTSSANTYTILFRKS